MHFWDYKVQAMMTDPHDIRIMAYSGYRADERPCAVVLDGQLLDIKEIEESWISSGIDPKSDVIRGFVVRCAGGARFRLVCNEKCGWTGELLAGPRIIGSL